MVSTAQQKRGIQTIAPDNPTQPHLLTAAGFSSIDGSRVGNWRCHPRSMVGWVVVEDVSFWLVNRRGVSFDWVWLQRGCVDVDTVMKPLCNE